MDLVVIQMDYCFGQMDYSLIQVDYCFGQVPGRASGYPPAPPQTRT